MQVSRRLRIFLICAGVCLFMQESSPGLVQWWKQLSDKKKRVVKVTSVLLGSAALSLLLYSKRRPIMEALLSRQSLIKLHILEDNVEALERALRGLTAEEITQYHLSHRVGSVERDCSLLGVAFSLRSIGCVRYFVEHYPQLLPTLIENDLRLKGDTSLVSVIMKAPKSRDTLYAFVDCFSQKLENLDEDAILFLGDMLLDPKSLQAFIQYCQKLESPDKGRALFYKAFSSLDVKEKSNVLDLLIFSSSCSRKEIFLALSFISKHADGRDAEMIRERVIRVIELRLDLKRQLLDSERASKLSSDLRKPRQKVRQRQRPSDSIPSSTALLSFLSPQQRAHTLSRLVHRACYRLNYRGLKRIASELYLNDDCLNQSHLASYKQGLQEAIQKIQDKRKENKTLELYEQMTPLDGYCQGDYNNQFSNYLSGDALRIMRLFLEYGVGNNDLLRLVVEKNVPSEEVDTVACLLDGRIPAGWQGEILIDKKGKGKAGSSTLSMGSPDLFLQNAVPTLQKPLKLATLKELCVSKLHQAVT